MTCIKWCEVFKFLSGMALPGKVANFYLYLLAFLSHFSDTPYRLNCWERERRFSLYYSWCSSISDT